MKYKIGFSRLIRFYGHSLAIKARLTDYYFVHTWANLLLLPDFPFRLLEITK